MPQPRIPVENLRAMGAAVKNPARYQEREEPDELPPLGEPSAHMKADARVAWFMFKSELPWLTESDRGIMETACHVRGKLIAGEDLSPNMLTILRQHLSALGATPADRSRVQTSGPKKRVVDPIESFFSA